MRKVRTLRRKAKAHRVGAMGHLKRAARLLKKETKVRSKLRKSAQR